MYFVLLVVAVIDASKPWNRSRLDKDVLTALTLHPDKKSILVMNKVYIQKNPWNGVLCQINHFQINLIIISYTGLVFLDIIIEILH